MSLPSSTGIRKMTYRNSDSVISSRDGSGWKIISLPSGATSFNGFKVFEPAFIQNGNNGWKPAASSTAGWIGITPNGVDTVPVGDYQYQITLNPTDCKNLDVGFSVDDTLKSVVVSDGTKTVQTITSFSGNGYEGLTTFSLMNLPAIPTLTFTVYNGGGPSGLLVQLVARTQPVITKPVTTTPIYK